MNAKHILFNRPLWEDYINNLPLESASLHDLSEAQADYIMELDLYVSYLEDLLSNTNKD